MAKIKIIIMIISSVGNPDGTGLIFDFKIKRFHLYSQPKKKWSAVKLTVIMINNIYKMPHAVWV